MPDQTVSFCGPDRDIMPLHPIIVHFPIALVMMAVVFQLLVVFLKRRYLVNSAWITLGLAALTAIAAALTGTA